MGINLEDINDPKLRAVIASSLVGAAPMANSTKPSSVDEAKNPNSSEALAATDPDFSISPSTDEEKLNKMEKQYLAYLRRLGFKYIGIQNITLKLGDDCRYTPDFSVIDENGRFVFHETKGFMRDDARAKLLIAARQFRMFDFVLVKRNGIGWSITEVKP